ncbi:serine/threonine kinase family protein, partial [Plesiocystis pacifica SIR-1]
LDNAKVVRAPTDAARLPMLSTCTDETLLELWVPPPTAPADRERVEALRADLDQVVALMLSSNYADALELAEATLSQAEALGWRPLIAEARFSAGDLYEATGDYAKARATLEQAFFEASAVGHDRVAVRTVGKLSWTTGQRLYDHEAALFWADMGDALVERVGLEGTLEQSRIEAGRAAVYMRQSRHDEALELYRSILATREPLLGADDIQVAAILNNIGLVHIQRGDLDEALDSLNRAREIREATLGAGHPEVGASLNNISLALEGLGRYGEALEAASAALELLEVAFGDAHPTIGASLNNVGYIYYEAGRYEEARRTFEKAVAVKERALGEAHPALTSTLTNLADTLVRLGEHEPARELLVRASGLRAAEDRSHHERGRADFTLARIVWATASADDRRTALGLARSAREHYVDEGSGYADKIAEID